MNDVRPVWTSDGRSIVFTSDGRDGTRALWRVGADGVGLRRLTTGDGPERLAGISRKGDKLVFTTAASELDIGLFDRVTGSFSRFGAQRRDFAPRFLRTAGE
jgi:Tol biopolymer transport system component